MFAAAIYNDHGTIVQICNPLTRLFTCFDDRYLHFFTGKYHRFDRIRQFIDIQNTYALEFCYFIQVKIICHNKCIHFFCHFQQHRVHFHRLFCLESMNFNRYCQLFLDLIQNIQTTTASLTFQAICRVRDMSQFFQNKIRNDDLTFDKTCLQQIHDSSIDDHACIQDLRSACDRIFRRHRFGSHQYFLQRSDINIILFPSGNTDTKNTQKDIQQDNDECSQNAEITESKTDQVCDYQTNKTTNYSKGKFLYVHFSQSFFCLCQSFHERICCGRRSYKIKYESSKNRKCRRYISRHFLCKIE